MLSQLEPASVIRVQTWDADAPAVLRQQAGNDVVCISPCEWLVIRPGEDSAAVGEALRGTAFRATDVSRALARLRLEGPHARDLLAKGCSLDLDPRRFGPGHATRARFAGMPLIVRCTGESAFHLIVARSYEQYLIDWITDAAAEF